MHMTRTAIIWIWLLADVSLCSLLALSLVCSLYVSLTYPQDTTRAYESPLLNLLFFLADDVSHCISNNIRS